LITGGSSGIGLAVAKEALKLNAKVTIVARSKAKLDEAQKLLHNQFPGCKIYIRPFDVTTGDVEEMTADVEQVLGPIYLLINCAGFSVPRRFEDLRMSDVRAMMDVNFMGTFAVTQAVVRCMHARTHDESDGKRRGGIVLCSSQGGLLGISGFTAYAASKAALIKFGEALDMEQRPRGVSVTVCVPPDTDTPGFETENLGKPEECRILSESAGLFSAEAVGKQMLSDALAGRFYSTVGIEGFMLVTLCAGFGPVRSFVDTVSQVLLMGLFRFISIFYLADFQRVIQREFTKREEAKKRE